MKLRRILLQRNFIPSVSPLWQKRRRFYSQLRLSVSRSKLFFGLLLRRQRSLEAVTSRARLDDMSAISDAVQQRFA